MKTFENNIDSIDKTSERIILLANTSIDIAEAAVRNVLKLSKMDIVKCQQADWNLKFQQVLQLKRQLSTKLKIALKQPTTTALFAVENRKITDDDLYLYMISFFEENDQLPTVDITAQHFGLAKNAIQQRFTKLEKHGRLVRNSLGKFMFPRDI